MRELAIFPKGTTDPLVKCPISDWYVISNFLSWPLWILISVFSCNRALIGKWYHFFRDVIKIGFPGSGLCLIPTSTPLASVPDRIRNSAKVSSNAKNQLHEKEEIWILANYNLRISSCWSLWFMDQPLREFQSSHLNINQVLWLVSCDKIVYCEYCARIFSAFTQREFIALGRIWILWPFFLVPRVVTTTDKDGNSEMELSGDSTFHE